MTRGSVTRGQGANSGHEPRLGNGLILIGSVQSVQTWNACVIDSHPIYYGPALHYITSIHDLYHFFWELVYHSRQCDHRHALRTFSFPLPRLIALAKPSYNLISSTVPPSLETERQLSFPASAPRFAYDGSSTSQSALPVRTAHRAPSSPHKPTHQIRPLLP